MSKDIWHTTKERPMLHRDIILCGDGWSIPMDIIPETVDNICWENVEKWCYVDDLIKENDHTRKALEQSEICCTEWEKQALDYKAENIALSGDLERTRKALEIAKTHLGCIKNNYNNWTPDRDDYMRAHAANCLAEIKELEDGNL